MLLSSASGLMIGHTHAISGVLGLYKNESSSGVCRVSAEVAIIWFFFGSLELQHLKEPSGN